MSKPDNLMLGLLLVLLLIIATAVLFLAWCINMPGKNPESLPALTAAERELASRLERHVNVLAGDIGVRHNNRGDSMAQASGCILGQFSRHGYTPDVQLFGRRPYRNIIVDIPGSRSPGEWIVVGAHYDTTAGTPGADDNASGVAGLLELGRLLAGMNLARGIRLVAFANEEEPYYGSEDMGSLVHAQRSREQGEAIVAMLSLEMIGYFSTVPGSQRYPAVIRPFYPEQGDFIAFVGNLASRALLHAAIAGFREQGRFPAEGMAAPEWLVPDIRRSDNAAFWEAGFPALMVTDTSNFRNPHYHMPTDTPETLDYASMARVVNGLAGMLQGLAQEP